MLLQFPKAADTYAKATETYAKVAMPFPPSDWKHVYKLLGLVIEASERTLEEKLSVFSGTAKELRTIIDPTLCITTQMTRDWFMRNQPELEGIIERGFYDKPLCDILAPIKSMPHKLDVISCMVRLAVTDGYYSDVEKNLINKTCLYWKDPEQLARYRRISQGVFLDASA